MNDPLSLLAFAQLPADDPYLVTAAPEGAVAAGLSFDYRPPAPRSLPDRLARPARPAPPRHRPRPGDHAAHRPTLAQRLPGTRPGRLAPQEGQGGHPQADRRTGPLLRQWVLGGPAAQGLDRANWTYAELAEHLYQAKGVRVRKSALQVFCHKHGIRPYRPTYRFLRGDPVKQAAARDDLAALKKKRRRVRSSC